MKTKCIFFLILTSLPVLLFGQDGTIDMTFGDSGYVIEDFDSRRDIVADFTSLQNDDLLIAGTSYALDFSENKGLLAKFKNDGTVDTSFGNNGKTYLEMDGEKMALQSDGKIVIAGNTWWYNGEEDVMMAGYRNNPLSINENDFQNAKRFPNPVSGTFVLELPNLSKPEDYAILDLSGKVIKTGVLRDVISTLDISEVQSGIYFLNVDMTTLRLIKE